MNNSFMVGLAFSLGFMIGSLFNLFIIKWLDNKIYHPKPEIKNKNLLKEIEKMMHQKDKQLKDLFFIIKNLNIHSHQKEKEEFNNFEIQKKDIKENIE